MRQMPPHDKKHSFTGAMKKLMRYCKPYLPAIIVALVFAVLGALMSVTGPEYVGDLTDEIEEGLFGSIDMGAVLHITLILIMIYALGWIFNFIQGYIMAIMSARITKSMRSDISSKINRMPLSYFDSKQFGDTLSRVSNDVDTVGTQINSTVTDLVNAITLFLGSLIMMVITNWQMALAAVLASLLGFGLMFVIIICSQKYFVRQQRALGSVNGLIEEVYSGHMVVKAYNAEDITMEDFKKRNAELYNNGWKANFISTAMMPLMGFVGNLGYVAVCVVGSVLMLNGDADIATIVSFMMYVRLFTNPLTTIAQANTNLQSAAAAADHVFEFLGEDEMEDESGKTVRLDDVKGKVEFDHVSFGYNSDRTIIKDFSCTVEPGMKVAIVGPTGAGKTTLVNLLMRFYEVNGGSIRIDGVPLTDLTRENIHSLFSMILQDTWMFEGTIRDNIVYSKEGVTDEQVMKACETVGLAHFIKTLPNGLDTIMDDSANLSAGQKQLITIARALIEDAPMLILDEATSSVDTRTERTIKEAMDAMTDGRTSFIIAHRLSTIRDADIILVLRDGDIVEKGSHEELMARNGFYAELYNSQFED